MTRHAAAQLVSGSRWRLRRQASLAAQSADALLSPRQWLHAAVGGWLVMGGAVVASWEVVADPQFMSGVAALLAASLPAAYRLRHSSAPRELVNVVVFVTAVILGLACLGQEVPTSSRGALYSLGDSYRLLLKTFLWVMVFRSFAVRSMMDVALSIIPATSCALLVLIRPPSVSAGTGLTVLFMASLYLLSLEQRWRRERSSSVPLQPERVTWAGRASGGAAINNWQVVAAVVLVVALAATMGLPHLRGPGDLASRVQVYLAQYVARFVSPERVDFSPGMRIALTGEPPPDSDRVLFTVKCNRAENWRQQTYDTYTGSAWVRRSRKSLRARRDNMDWYVDTSLVSGAWGAGTIAVEQEFRIRAPASGSLPGLFLATKVSAPVRSIRMSETGAIGALGWLRPGDTYRVVSEVPTGALRAPPGQLRALSAELRARYLQLPATLPDRVRQRARELTANTRGPLDAANTLETHLATTYRYDLRPRLLPDDRDFVDHFLFESRAGYCHHFASAMVVLCRCVGIPARLVTGFVAGERTREPDTYEVRVKDAHSWVEAYLEGQGWRAFDPTPPREEHAPGVSIAALAQAAATWGRGIASRLQQAVASHRLVGGALLAAALAGLVGLAHRRRRLYRRIRLGGADPSATDRVLFVYGQMLRWLADRGVPRHPSHTPTEYVGELRRTGHPAHDEARQVTECYLRARLSAHGASAPDAVTVEQSLKRLWTALRRPPRATPDRTAPWA